eukprot:TRINITY_DN1993_c0_g1_i4.p1 TRINITY_DN1993_c0_g1~~TRINITY_DN1993_c0_g1_i4.p1  ORF type:complete len:360 (-),score=48.39 TRINITY_DN1993_c0_g1_i4:109-1188(-)
MPCSFNFFFFFSFLFFSFLFFSFLFFSFLFFSFLFFFVLVRSLQEGPGHKECVIGGYYDPVESPAGAHHWESYWGDSDEIIKGWKVRYFFARLGLSSGTALDALGVLLFMRAAQASDGKMLCESELRNAVHYYKPEEVSMDYLGDAVVAERSRLLAKMQNPSQQQEHDTNTCDHHQQRHTQTTDHSDCCHGNSCCERLFDHRNPEWLDLWKRAFTLFKLSSGRADYKLGAKFMRMFLKPHDFLIAPIWCDFVERTARDISKDTWLVLPQFISFMRSDSTMYDVDDAWPGYYDDFMAYAQKSAIMSGTLRSAAFRRVAELLWQLSESKRNEALATLPTDLHQTVQQLLKLRRYHEATSNA